MDRLNAMELFVRIVDAGSLSEAARRSGRSLATVVRGLAGLEEHLGTQLLNRTTRKLRLTEAGADYLGHAREILRLVGESEQAAAREVSHPSGLLTVSAPLLFGRWHVAPVLTELLASEPELSVELVLTDRVVDMLDDGIDVAVRIGPLPDSSLRATEVGRVRRMICASPAYLARAGVPRTLEELAQHQCLQFLSGRGQPQWALAGPEASTRPSCSRFSCNTADALVDAAIRGQGVVSLLSYQVAQAVATGELVEVLREFAGPTLPVSVIHAHSRMVPAKVRAFRDAMRSKRTSLDFS